MGRDESRAAAASVGERIRRRIAERGPLPFDEYMREALYGPGGFYERARIGAGGDFVTSPHVHPVFARLLGIALEMTWDTLGRPAPLRLVEVGAGDGTLARELLAGFTRGEIDVAYTAVEVGAEARRRLGEIGLRVVDRVTDAGPLDPAIVVANELLDNLPFRPVRRRGGALVELRVGLDGGRLVEVEVPCPTELAALAGSVPEGAEAPVPTGAFAFVDELAGVLRRGYAVLIDYGAAGGPPEGGADVAAGGPDAGTGAVEAGPLDPGEARVASSGVHGYRGHRLVEDVLADPGTIDITAGVDLGAVEDRARQAGLEPLGHVSQGAALRALGFDGWMRDERDRQARHLDAEHGLEAIRTWGGRSRAALLVDPAGLGRLRWLVIATPGLAEPEWFARARGATTGSTAAGSTDSLAPR